MSEKREFDQTIYRGLLIRGDLLGAIAYLKEFPDKRDLVERYAVLSMGEEASSIVQTENSVLREILRAYHAYYRNIFFLGVKPSEAAEALFDSFRKAYGSETADLDNEEVEEFIGELVRREGYEFLGGTTSGFYGPYVWKVTQKTRYDVELPEGTHTVVVNMMEGFVSRSWLDYLSFGEIGTGGWAKEEELYCVKSLYADNFGKPEFEISYLKHETQHKVDLLKYRMMAPKDLEYRAKLTELSYYTSLELLKNFLAEADGKNKENAHSYSAHVILKQLSEKIFQEEFVLDFDRWDGRGDEVRAFAKELLRIHTSEADAQNGSPVDLI